MASGDGCRRLRKEHDAQRAGHRSCESVRPAVQPWTLTRGVRTRSPLMPRNGYETPHSSQCWCSESAPDGGRCGTTKRVSGAET